MDAITTPPAPDERTRLARPKWLPELTLVVGGYWLYSLIRNEIRTDPAAAYRHGRAVQHLQERLGFDVEVGLNRWVAAHEIVAQAVNYYYATLHLALTAGVLGWLFWARPLLYRTGRTALMVATLAALAGFYFYPLAPPRLLPEYGYIDTLARFHTGGSLADGSVAAHSNQFAAMPSLHVAWALWVSWVLWRTGRGRWRTLAFGYPVATIAVVVGTGNHFVVDVVGGIVVMTVGWAAVHASRFRGWRRHLPVPRAQPADYDRTSA